MFVYDYSTKEYNRHVYRPKPVVCVSFRNGVRTVSLLEETNKGLYLKYPGSHEYQCMFRIKPKIVKKK
jgi:hypothetical protein